MPDVLDRAVRCVMGFAGRRGPMISPLAFWSDGAELWMSTPAGSVKARALRQRPSCSVYVAPPDGVGNGAVVSGSVKIYGLHNPVSLAVHGPVVSTAMAALAGRNAGTILGYVQDARHVPERFRPHNRVALRLRIDRIDEVEVPPAGPGAAPPLPAVVAPDVRRALGAARQVCVATPGPDGQIDVTPAVWDQRFRMDFPPGMAPLPVCDAAVHVGADPQRRPTAVVGVSLNGRLDHGRFVAQRATWWEGFRLKSADVPAPTASLQLPD